MNADEKGNAVKLASGSFTTVELHGPPASFCVDNDGRVKVRDVSLADDLKKKLPGVKVLDCREMVAISRRVGEIVSTSKNSSPVGLEPRYPNT